MSVTDNTINKDSSVSNLGDVRSFVNGGIPNVPHTSPNVGEYTSNANDVTGIIYSGTTLAIPHFRYATSATDPDGSTDMTSSNGTREAHTSTSSSTVAIAITIPVLLVLIVAGLIWLYKRYHKENIVRVWQIPGTHNIPKDKPKASWYEDETVARADDGYNPDLELQPYHMPGSMINICNETEDDCASSDTDDAGKTEADDSNAVFDSSTKAESNLVPDSKLTAIREKLIARDLFLKKTMEMLGIKQNEECSDDEYDEFADHVIDIQNGDTLSADTNEDDDDDGYIAMAFEPNTDVSEQLHDVRLRQKEEESDDIYANVETRKAQSMNAIPHVNDKPELHLPKRGMSESYIHSNRPPVPQPRLSKKKIIDAIKPEIPDRVQNDTSVSTKSDLVGSHERLEEPNTDSAALNVTQESATDSDSTEKFSDAEHNVEDHIYDYPRNNSRVVYPDELEDESIDKVSTSENS